MTGGATSVMRRNLRIRVPSGPAARRAIASIEKADVQERRERIGR